MTKPAELVPPIVNHTSLRAHVATCIHADDSQTLTMVAKATLAIPSADGEVCSIAPEPLELLLEPTYAGEPKRSSILRPADVVPYKCGTDVILVGNAYAPRGRPVAELTASVEVGDLRKSIAVIGDRQWRRAAHGLEMTEPVPFERMPLCYERAYGGCPPSQRGRAWPDRDKRNPIGTGYCVTERDAHGMPLPNLEVTRERIRSWRDVPPVAGLGAIEPSWAPRRRPAAKRNESPDPCETLELDPRFYSVASSGLWSDGPLSGELHVELVHLSTQPVLRFRLPDIRVRMDCHLGGFVQKRRAELWTVVLEPDERRVSMVWGARCRVDKPLGVGGRIEIQTETPLPE